MRSPSSVSFDGAGEGGCCIVVAGVALAVGVLGTLDECSGGGAAFI